MKKILLPFLFTLVACNSAPLKHEENRFVRIPNSDLRIALPNGAIIQSNWIASEAKNTNSDTYFAFGIERISVKSVESYIESMCSASDVLFPGKQSQVRYASSPLLSKWIIDSACWPNSRHFAFHNGVLYLFANSGEETSAGMDLFTNTMRSLSLAEE